MDSVCTLPPTPGRSSLLIDTGESNKERLFDNVAWLCEVTCLEYERIAFRYAARIPQTPIDEEGGMSAVVICNYRESVPPGQCQGSF